MNEKPLRWLHGEIKTPPISINARRELGMLLRELQDGANLGMPQSRPMPSIGRRCHELRVNDANKVWRLVYCIRTDAIIILDVFEKKTRVTPADVVDNCIRRLKHYEANIS